MRTAMSAVMIVALPSLAAAQSGSASMAALNWREAAVVDGLPGPASLVAANESTSCAVASGDLYCWGRLTPLGLEGASDKPRLIRDARGVTQLSIGALGACALTTANRVLCWGYAFAPKSPKSSPSPKAESTPRVIAGLSGARKISTGELFACAQRDDRRVACWGDNRAGELGQLPPDPNAPKPAPKPKPKPSSSANRRALLLQMENQAALLSLAGPREPSAPPAPSSPMTAMVVPLLDDVVDLAAGKQHACAVRATGEVVCWRTGDARPSDPDALKPGEVRVIRNGERAAIPKLTDAVAVNALDRESCILGRDGGLLLQPRLLPDGARRAEALRRRRRREGARRSRALGAPRLGRGRARRRVELLPAEARGGHRRRPPTPALHIFR